MVVTAMPRIWTPRPRVVWRLEHLGIGSLPLMSTNRCNMQPGACGSSAGRAWRCSTLNQTSIAKVLFGCFARKHGQDLRGACSRKGDFEPDAVGRVDQACEFQGGVLSGVCGSIHAETDVSGVHMKIAGRKLIECNCLDGVFGFFDHQAQGIF